MRALYRPSATTDCLLIHRVFFLILSFSKSLCIGIVTWVVACVSRSVLVVRGCHVSDPCTPGARSMEPIEGLP